MNGQDENVIRILTWPGGYHVYAKVGRDDVVDRLGNQKWSSESEAIDAALWYVENNSHSL